MTFHFIITTTVLLGGFIAWGWFKDKFASLDTFSDDFEGKYLKPRGLHWGGKGGNPITWLHHTLWTGAVALLGAVVALFTGTHVVLGAAVWGGGFVLFYLIRETWSAIKRHRADTLFNRPHFKKKHPYTSRAVDGFMDVLCPLVGDLILWGVWLLVR